MESDSDQRKKLNQDIYRELGAFVESRSSTFTCGGSVPIVPVSQSLSEAETSAEDVHQFGTDKLSSPPITIRWDSQSTDTTNKITLPILPSDDEGQGKLTALVKDCQPASFGYQGKDVYDEKYRKATKLDCSDFSTSFCPYTLGIIDTIAQVLLPNAPGGNSRTGVRAELYKLNVYSAPSGFFKAHVDTPRSTAQFGSLVVSLPCRHEGGQLVVRHAGHSVTYDWSTSKAKTEVAQCQWAAFYSDCEHEVLELSEGHRLTLTYNLYVVRGVGQLAGSSPALDFQSLPLYQKVKEALSNPIFMPEGGYIGIYCTHAYPHNSKLGQESLPGILKGADMAVYTVFRALGLKVKVKTVLDDEEANHIMEAWGGKPFSGNRIGSWDSINITETGGCEDDDWKAIIRSFPHYKLKVNWLTDRRAEFRKMGFVHMTYGNEAGIDAMYTYAILLVKVTAVHSRISATSEDQVADASRKGSENIE
ncbi:hypothetical protein F5X96DRAFT_490204 [Biscogniauxia mediterranea]|nr:hypothetical protein F5X96DRAFT_490204 [Biscogniauxia mediterranea]